MDTAAGISAGTAGMLGARAVLKSSLIDPLLGPGEWLCCRVVGCNESIDVLLQLGDGGERSAGQRLALENRKPGLDLVEPRRPRRGEMELHVRMPLEPAVVLLMSVEIVEDDVKLAIRVGRGNAVHEAEELNPPPPLGMRCDHSPGRDLEGGKQGRRAVPLVVVALPGQGPPVRQLQIALRPLQSLDRWLFVDTENNRLGRRPHISRPRRRLSPRRRGRCSRTRICGRPGRSCAHAETARHTERQRRPAPAPPAGPSTALGPAVVADRAPPGCAYSSPDRRAAPCFHATGPSALPGPPRQSVVASC